MIMRRILTVLVVSTVVVMAQKKTRQTPSNTENLGDDYSDFASQPVKNAGANHQLKQVTYSTIAPKFDIPTTRAPLLNPNPIGQRGPGPVGTPPKKPAVVDYRRGYFFQHYPWDRLPRRYLLRPGMTYVYPPQFHGATYRYPYLPYTDHYSIYRTHPGIGGGCGGSGGCGGYQGYGGYAQQYQQYQGYGSSGCGGGSGTGCGGYEDDDDDDEDYESSEESGKSGEAKINKKDPLEDLELEDLEKLSKSDDTKSSSDAATSDDLEVEPTEIKKSKGKSEHLDDEDLIDDRKKQAKRNFLVKWA